MTTPIPANDIFDINPYESHPSLTTTETEVLWEYAKLAQHVKLVGKLGSYLQLASRLRCWESKVTQKTRLLSEEPDQMLLARLRVLEKKMGLVLTLVDL
jgi:DASH complex subunit DAD3